MSKRNRGALTYITDLHPMYPIYYQRFSDSYSPAGQIFLSRYFLIRANKKVSGTTKPILKNTASTIYVPYLLESSALLIVSGSAYSISLPVERPRPKDVTASECSLAGNAKSSLFPIKIPPEKPLLQEAGPPATIYKDSHNESLIFNF